MTPITFIHCQITNFPFPTKKIKYNKQNKMDNL